MTAAWIDTTAALDAWVAGLGRDPKDPIALDTEADSFHHYREKVCLLQLSSGGRHALVDPLAEVDLAPLAPAFARSSIPKILHGADYDIRLLARDFGLSISGLYDTMIAARLLGEPALGLAALLSKYLGVTLDKTHQRADWSKRPLSPPLREYAVEDTRHLESLAAILGARVAELNRTAWASEECERLEAVRWRDRKDTDPEPFRRTKGAHALDRPALAVLREIHAWRETAASRRDKPLFRILRDETLIALAKAQPRSDDDLSRIPGFPGSWIGGPQGVEILEAVGRGAETPEADRPVLRVEERERLPPAVVARLAVLRTKRDHLAHELQLDPSVLASRAILEELAKRVEAGDDPWTISELRRWQIDLLRPALT